MVDVYIAMVLLFAGFLYLLCRDQKLTDRCNLHGCWIKELTEAFNNERSRNRDKHAALAEASKQYATNNDKRLYAIETHAFRVKTALKSIAESDTAAEPQ